ncbi:hypothetical protein LGT41_0012295 [Abyssibius alkaniclasticus]|uniref:hypothetical protein n=1 Tax=Abyssibius alkaniclasticus TaxID=2881234 RepID=UPI0023635094|nr:hypothetical protein [Abyssibius alkaniclasticus]UPH70565.1 hypothetical protein LGT41_0012295 [Abyssibius alkaniclasticus]
MEAFHLHIGVRKSGTTYLQRWLDRSTFAPNTRWVNERDVRATLTVTKEAPDYLHGDAAVVMSDENLLGGFKNGEKFARPSADLRILAPFAPRIFLCLRNYADYFTSSWTEAIKRQSFWAFDPGVKPTRRWGDVLREIAARLPNSPVTVWDYADFRGNEDAVAQLVSGNRIVEFGARPPRHINKRLSVSAVAQLALLAEPPSKGGPFKAFFESNRVSEANPRFEAFTAETRKPFDEAYAEDWDEVAKFATIWRPSPQTPSR